MQISSTPHGTLSLRRSSHPFYSRQWVFQKLDNFLAQYSVTSETRGTASSTVYGNTSAGNGILIVGASGCGKTTLCQELSKRATLHGHPLGERLSRACLLFYTCSLHNVETLSVKNFLLYLRNEILTHPLLGPSYQEYLMSESNLKCNFDDMDSLSEWSVDDVFKQGILLPLLSINAPQEHMFILIDSLDEAQHGSHLLEYISTAIPRGSKTILELITTHRQLFPEWLHLIGTVRSQERAVLRHFTGFRKITLDDVNKQFVVSDLQQYILERVDHEERLRMRLSPDAAELLNMLHIKSNGSFLYLKMVLDAISEGTICMPEIAYLPCTLNGLFYWLMNRLFPSSLLPDCYTWPQRIFTVILAADTFISVHQLYFTLRQVDCDPPLNYHHFQMHMSLLHNFLVISEEGNSRVQLFHDSFSHWLQDVKHATVQYVCSKTEGHFLMAKSFILHPHLWNYAFKERAAYHLWLANLPEIQRRGFEEKSLRDWLNTHPLARWSCLLRDKDHVQNAGQYSLLESHLYDGNDEEIEEEDELTLGQEENLYLALHKSIRSKNCDTFYRLLHANGNLYLEERDSRHRTPLLLAVHSYLDQRLPHSHSNTASTSLRINKDLHPLRRLPLADSAYHSAGTVALPVDQLSQKLMKEPSQSTDLFFMMSKPAVEEEENFFFIQGLLEVGVDVNTCDVDGNTPLMLAAKGGHLSLCDILLESGANVNSQNTYGQSALVMSVEQGHIDVVSRLILWGADIYCLDNNGRSLISLASSRGHVKVLRLLQQHGLDEEHKDNDEATPLHLAASEGHVDVCRVLIECGAKLNVTDKYGSIPLLLAWEKCHVPVIELLLNAYPMGILQPSLEGHSCFMLCGLTQQPAMLLRLCVTALQRLPKSFNGVNWRDNEGGRTLLYLCSLSGLTLSVELLLTESHADPSICDNDGRSPLHVAAWQGHIDICRLMIQLVGKNSVQSNRRSMIQGNGNGLLSSCGTLLLPHQLSTLQRDYQYRLVHLFDSEGRTALHTAAWKGHVSVCQWLLEGGTSVDIPCQSDGATALAIAAQEGHVSVCELLLQAGANFNCRDHRGRNTLHVALHFQQMSIVRLLEEHGAALNPQEILLATADAPLWQQEQVMLLQAGGSWHCPSSGEKSLDKDPNGMNESKQKEQKLRKKENGAVSHPSKRRSESIEVSNQVSQLPSYVPTKLEERYARRVRNVDKIKDDEVIDKSHDPGRIIIGTAVTQVIHKDDVVSQFTRVSSLRSCGGTYSSSGSDSPTYNNVIQNHTECDPLTEEGDDVPKSVVSLQSETDQEIDSTKHGTVCLPSNSQNVSDLSQPFINVTDLTKSDSEDPTNCESDKSLSKCREKTSSSSDRSLILADNPSISSQKRPSSLLPKADLPLWRIRPILEPSSHPVVVSKKNDSTLLSVERENVVVNSPTVLLPSHVKHEPMSSNMSSSTLPPSTVTTPGQCNPDEIHKREKGVSSTRHSMYLVQRISTCSSGTAEKVNDSEECPPQKQHRRKKQRPNSSSKGFSKLIGSGNSSLRKWTRFFSQGFMSSSGASSIATHGTSNATTQVLHPSTEHSAIHPQQQLSAAMSPTVTQMTHTSTSSSNMHFTSNSSLTYSQPHPSLSTQPAHILTSSKSGLATQTNTKRLETLL